MGYTFVQSFYLQYSSAVFFRHQDEILDNITNYFFRLLTIYFNINKSFHNNNNFY